MPLINCEINLVLTWSDMVCVLTDIMTRAANHDADTVIPAINTQT